ncbi:glycosyltransferase [Pseudonocardiaceae bacterium YIM PH 21723]|nr:glycosyltransferase [Pseudonocardiaceae bacterium YIM PH 21723]
MSGSGVPVLHTAAVLAVLICRDDQPELRQALSSLRWSTTRARHVLAVHLGSDPAVAGLLAKAVRGPDERRAGLGAQRILDGVITLSGDVDIATATHAAVELATERWGDPGTWLWIVTGDSAPDHRCLATLLGVAELSPGVGVLGPLTVDWADPRLPVEAGLSIDAVGRRRDAFLAGAIPLSTLMARDLLTDLRNTEVLAVPASGSLIRRELWEQLGGFDTAAGPTQTDLDFGWRANRSGTLVLTVPAARIRRATPPPTDQAALTADRIGGLRTYLVNSSGLAFSVAMPRLLTVGLARSVLFGLRGKGMAARAELGALWHLVRGKAHLIAARKRKISKPADLPGDEDLVVTLLDRVRDTFSTKRPRSGSDALIGPARLAVETATQAWSRPAALRRRTGPEALPSGALGHRFRSPRTTAAGRLLSSTGIRQPSAKLVIDLPESALHTAQVRRRPSPVPHGTDHADPQSEIVFDEPDVSAHVRRLLLRPSVLLPAALLLLAIVVDWGRWSVELSGGALRPVGDLAGVWSQYVANWHAVGGGSSSQAPTALAVLGLLGVPFWPIGGPSAAVALLLLLDIPLAGLCAYLAVRRVSENVVLRVVLAAGYALLPTATAAVAQGHLDVVVAHILLPAALAGIGAILLPSGRTGLLSSLSATTLVIAVIGAFSPLLHLTLIALLIGGYVVLPPQTDAATARRSWRRVVAVVSVVALPLVLLLPWSLVAFSHPQLLLHGIGGPLEPTAPAYLSLPALSPGGPGAAPVIGLLVVLAGIAAFAVRRSRIAVPGLVLAGVGLALAYAVSMVPMTPLGGGDPRAGWPGAPLLLVACGMGWVLLTTVPHLHGSLRLGARTLGYVVLASFAVGAIWVGGSGPVAPGAGWRLPALLETELGRSKPGLLVIGQDGVPSTLTTGRMPQFGDDALVLAAPDRLTAFGGTLRHGSPQQVSAALSQVAALGAEFIVLPDEQSQKRVLQAAPDLVIDTAPTTSGLPMLRVLLSHDQVQLLSQEMTQKARTSDTPPEQVAVPGVNPVQATLPDVRVKTSEGADQRLLTLAAEWEPGWQATVDGQTVAVVRAWTHQVGVLVPSRSAEIRVWSQSVTRDVLLLLQAATALFVLITAIPIRRRVETDL